MVPRGSSTRVRYHPPGFCIQERANTRPLTTTAQIAMKRWRDREPARIASSLRSSITAAIGRENRRLTAQALGSSVLQLDAHRMALGLADVPHLVQARLTPVGGTGLPLVANPLAVWQRARLERVFGQTHAHALQMTMRLLFGAGRDARFEHPNEGVVDDQFVIFRNHFEHVEIVGLRPGRSCPCE